MILVIPQNNPNNSGELRPTKYNPIEDIKNINVQSKIEPVTKLLHAWLTSFNNSLVLDCNFFGSTSINNSIFSNGTTYIVEVGTTGLPDVSDTARKTRLSVVAKTLALDIVPKLPLTNTLTVPKVDDNLDSIPSAQQQSSQSQWQTQLDCGQ